MQMADVVFPVVCFAAGAATSLLVDRGWPRRRFRPLARELEQALRRGEFEMRYQPIVDLDRRRWHALEALLRWRTPAGTLIVPDLFLPIAASAGMMQAISERVIELVGRDLGPVLRRHRDLHVAINIPPDLLGQGGPRDAATRCGMSIAAEQVIIEITETGFLDSLGREGLAAARAMGTRIAIDDFGTGLNGLAQLQDLEIDYIKIDKSFVRKIGSPSPGARLVDTIVGIARDVGASTIAEGVETEAQAAYLAELGVGYAQGWRFSRPLSLPDLQRQLEGSSDVADEGGDGSGRICCPIMGEITNGIAGPITSEAVGGCARRTHAAEGAS